MKHAMKYLVLLHIINKLTVMDETYILKSCEDLHFALERGLVRMNFSKWGKKKKKNSHQKTPQDYTH